MGFWTPWRGAQERSGQTGTGASTPAQPLASAAQAQDGALIPTLLTQERISAWFKEQGFHFFIDSDEDLGGIWHSRVFFFFLHGEASEILQVRSQWNREVTIERIDELLTFCNSWNTERLWPKTYLRVRDNGMIQVCAEMSIDLEHGVTDDQLGVQLRSALSTQTAFWSSLDELYPDPAADAA